MKKTLRVLIVEDSENDAALLLRSLRKEGYDVVSEVVDTQDAMRTALEHQDWDVITSDHAMPHFSAPEALALAKALRPSVPFIILSGEIDLSLAVSLMKGGAHDYIQKRDLSRIVPAIERELKEAESRLQRKLLEENLRTHQIELEMQNEELRLAGSEREKLQTRYFDLYDLAPVGYCTVSEKGLILEANLTASTMLDVTRNALVKQPLSRFILKEDQDIYYRCHKQLFETAERQAHELRMEKKDGTEFWARLEAAPAQDADGAPVCRVVMTDVTDRRRMEKVLTFLAQTGSGPLEEPFFEALARYLAESLGMDFICIDRLEGDGLTARTVAVWCDGKFEDNVSYALQDTPCGEVVGKAVCCFPASVCQFFPRDQVLQDLRAESYVGVTLWGHTGQPIGLIAVIGRRPLENRRLAEDILKLVAVRAAGEMERLEAEKERQLLQERLLRAEKMEALGLLAGGVAHDLNNALGILVGYAELLHDGLKESDPLQKDIRNIMKGGEQAAAIVQDLLTLARRGVHTKAVVNLNKTVTEYLKSPEHLKLTTFHPTVRIKTELDEELLKVAGSPIHLSKTLMNLVSNAVEAMPSGGDVVIRTESRHLARPVSAYDTVQEGEYVLLSVADTGEGIKEEDTKRIFEPFYTKKVMGRSGTGLGLSVVWGTVKDHDGYIDVHSITGKGTTFTLYFPVTDEEVGAEIVPMPGEFTGHGEKILVVDDIAIQRDLASRILTGINYSVATVADGKEAVEYLKTKEADLIVLDMIMDPGIDGFETYRQIAEFRPGQKAIIVSGFAETDRVKMTQSLGAGAFVRKPYIKERIGLAVRKELDRKF